MNQTTTAAIGAIACGLLGLFVLLPAAVAIPARLDAQWSKEVEAHLQQSGEVRSADYTYPFKHKVLLALAAALIGFGVVWKLGTTPSGVALGCYFLSLLLLVAINLKHSLLPDVVVLSTLWAGLLFHASAGHATTSIYGASVGYLVPFLVGLAMKMATRAEVIGRGDLKTLAMAGAWFGGESMAMLFGAFIGGLILWLVITKFLGNKPQTYIATAPAHLVASLVVAFGPSAL